MSSELIVRPVKKHKHEFEVSWSDLSAYHTQQAMLTNVFFEMAHKMNRLGLDGERLASFEVIREETPTGLKFTFDITTEADE